MFKTLFKFSAAFVLTTFLWISGVMASGKMEVPLGQEVILQADDLVVGEDYKWVVTQDKEILNTQAGTAFSYIFDRQGEYKVNLSATDQLGEVRNTTISIMAGGRYSKPNTGSPEDVFDVPLNASFSTLPQMSADKTVTLLGEGGRVAFDLAYRADVLEYRIDRNIFIDSDGNGIPNDDIDNSADSSYLLSGIWQTTYNSSESKQIAAEVTVVNAAGKTSTSQVKILFGPFATGQGSLLAVLDTLPATSPTDKKIYVPGQKATVAFYPRRSQGEIQEYRIDSNIFVDSDGDGDPANDVDNLKDDSFKTGDVWTATYQKTDQKIIAQLIVVSKDGSGSRIQREIIFRETPTGDAQTTGTTISLTADKEFVQKGDPINFTVEGLALSVDNYNFNWDFNGDAKMDQTVEGVNKVTYIYDTPGIQKASVQVQDKDGNVATFTKEIQVKDTQETAANFEATVNGLTVTFKNLSTGSASLEDKNLTYTWNFGDTDEKNYAAQKSQLTLENPTYKYLKTGSYQVALTVSDAAQVSSTKTLKVDLNSTETPVTSTEPTKNSGSGSVTWNILKIVLYVILAVVVFILLTLIGFLGYLKIKHPDLVFEELIDELKIKILSLLGMHDVLEEEVPAVTGGTIPPYKPQQPRPPEKPTPAPKPAPVVEVKPQPKKVEPDLSKSDAPMPEWLKTKDQTTSSSTPPASQKPPVIEGEVVEARPIPAKPVQPSPASSVNPSTSNPTPKPDASSSSKDLTKPDGPVPDWLKQN